MNGYRPLGGVKPSAPQRSPLTRSFSFPGATEEGAALAGFPCRAPSFSWSPERSVRAVRGSHLASYLLPGSTGASWGSFTGPAGQPWRGFQARGYTSPGDAIKVKRNCAQEHFIALNVLSISGKRRKWGSRESVHL